MKQPYFYLALIASLLGACAPTAQLQQNKDEIQRISLLLEKERADNDQLNTQRSIYEGQLQTLQTNNTRQIAEANATIESLKQQVTKLTTENTRKDERYKALEDSYRQERESHTAAVEAMDSKIEDLAQDKRELQVEKYQLKKAATKRKPAKRRRRR
jgi:predicted  nucleic acid-binding Zn-ribbon protein